MNLASIPYVDFYVSVIDNYGDMGFAVNLALSLHEKYPDMVIRFFSDDSGLFQKFFHENVPDWMEYMPLEILKHENPVAPSKLICSFFDYPLQKEYLAKFPYEKTIVAFSCFVLHNGLESLHKTMYLMESGYDTVIHFIPSLVPLGGGIIINPEIERRKAELSRMSEIDARRKFLLEIMDLGKVEGIGDPGSKDELHSICGKKWISVFVYKDTLEKILPVLESADSDTVFWVCGDPSGVDESQNCRILPFLPLVDYGVFQSLCDMNIVRGENSLCQGLLSGRPLLWDIYKESNGAHSEKTEDFMQWMAPYFPMNTNYQEIARDFMNEGNIESFKQFIREYASFVDAFKELSKDVHRDSNLIEKLENI